MIDYVGIGKRIRFFREHKGFTQEQLAYAINTSAAYISNIERAKKKPSLEKIVQIAEVLAITIEELISIDHKKSEHTKNELETFVSNCSESERRELYFKLVSNL